MITRTQQILHTFSSRTEFEWGKNDCCLWTADILKCIHKKDYAEKLRGTYNSELQFKKLLVKEGCENLLDLLIKTLGAGFITPGYALIGDPVLLRENNEYILGVCYGTYALFLTKEGTTSRKLEKCFCSWRI